MLKRMLGHVSKILFLVQNLSNTVPKTDTGRLAENAKALGRKMLKGTRQIGPVTSGGRGGIWSELFRSRLLGTARG